MNYSYLILVAVGLFLAIFGFIKNGKREGNTFGSALLFLLGIISLILGILLANVPGFFSG
ncbi:MAG: hypothetical protein K8S62_12710 [Candidatus Sabulitectum sp.]|nr:hypothetical protein [Candidatus Sabulitectum sp.]